MIDKIKFMELLTDLKEIAAVQGNVLAKEDIQGYLKDITLNTIQYQSVYQYLTENGIRIDKEGESGQKETMKTDSLFLSQYEKELEPYLQLSKMEEERLLEDTKNGIIDSKERLIKGWQKRIISLAKKYQNQDMPVEDLMQEGNIGLLIAINTYDLWKKIINKHEYLEESVMKAMEDAIDLEMETDDLENMLLMRSNLVHEALLYLSKDLGRVATLEELSDYTKLSKEEILELNLIARDSIEIGKGE